MLLNDGSKHINVAGWRKNATLPQRVETSRRRSRRCLLMSLALAKTSAQQVDRLSSWTIMIAFLLSFLGFINVSTQFYVCTLVRLVKSFWNPLDSQNPFLSFFNCCFHISFQTV